MVAAKTPGTSETRTESRRTHLIGAVDRWRPGRVFLAALLLFVGLHTVWSLATPLGGSPDEIAHIAKAAGVAHGQVFGRDVDGTQLREFDIPAGVRGATDGVLCSILKPNQPANCGPLVVEPDDEMIPVVTSAGLYNPVYYAIVGWPSLVWHNAGAVYAMRLLSGLLVGAFFALAVACLWLLPKRRLPLLAVLGLVTPTVAFLGGMVNPNALEVATVTAFTSALLVALRLRATGQLLARLAAVMAVAGALSVHARSLAPLWILVAVIVALCLFGWCRFWAFLRQRATLFAVAAVVVSGVLALLVLLSTGTLNEMGDYPGKGTPWYIGLRVTFDSTWDTLPNLIGAFGWNEVRAPQFAIVCLLGMALALIGGAIVAGEDRGARLGVVLAVVLFAALPAVIQGASVTKSGYIWQGRYGLALAAVVVLAAAAVAAPAFARVSRAVADRLVVIVIAVLALAHGGSLMTLVHRYALGVEAEGVVLFTGAHWTPFALPGPVVTAAIWIASAAWFVLALLLVRESPAGAPDPEALNAAEAPNTDPAGAADAEAGTVMPAFVEPTATVASGPSPKDTP